MIPDLTQKVIGFRQWNIEGSKLMPVGDFHSEAWKPGPQRAYCAKKVNIGGRMVLDPCIPVVQPYCACGFYALHKLSEAHWAGDSIRGIVLGWGRMAIHNQGWRAQFVELAALVYPAEATNQERMEVDFLANAYHVPTIPWEDAESYAKEFGDYCPESLKPRSWSGAELQTDQIREHVWNDQKMRANGQIPRLPQHLHEDEIQFLKIHKLVEDALATLDVTVPEAYAALHNIYVPNVGELLDGLIHGIEVEYVPKPEKIKPSEIEVDRNFELSISTNATVLWLPLQAPVRHS